MFETKVRGNCPLCGGEETSKYIEYVDIPVVECRNCQFLYSGRVCEPSAVASYYQCSFGSERHRMGQEVNARVNAGIIRRLTTIHSGCRILDVGAGYGYLVKAIGEQKDVEVIGVEPSIQEARFGADVLRVNVVEGFLEDSGLEEGSFDLIVCCEVIEHVLDPITFIRKMAGYARKGGKIVIATDNFRAQVVDRMGAAWPKWIPHSHVCHFDWNSLQRCIDRVGGLAITAMASFTPWECYVSAFLAGVRRRRSDQECFDLQRALSTEMNGVYRFHLLRRMINEKWAQWNCANDERGAIIYVVARRI